MTATISSKHFVILGAGSASAIATARRLATDGHALTLLARRADVLAESAADLKVRGARQVHVIATDLADNVDQKAILLDAQAACGVIDGVLVFYGVLGDQARAEIDLSHAREIIDVNFTSAALWVLAAAEHLETHPKPDQVLLTISSVAGDRGRRSNYVYGAAKGGLSVLVQGLAHKWANKTGAPRAVNMKLGFVDTPMTADIEKGGPLWAQPDDIAQAVCRAIQSGGPVQYAPWFWRWIMLAIRATPAFIFNKVNL
ncbi:SDR family NAD(P)-dependent oxidoreductase [uncultured Maricaulis sp.]|uniref:SDR family NAD(P)-dependent oxidoreductase n=1 Tax=uncultured Maricaulis sp. TaxID=174710 RepID=UPI0030D9086E|tara:strand:- start:795 stop:1565 length:771 start_codon:yes stop_codon:yes gene_type:complete